MKIMVVFASTAFGLTCGGMGFMLWAIRIPPFMEYAGIALMVVSGLCLLVFVPFIIWGIKKDGKDLIDDGSKDSA